MAAREVTPQRDAGRAAAAARAVASDTARIAFAPRRDLSGGAVELDQRVRRRAAWSARARGRGVGDLGFDRTRPRPGRRARGSASGRRRAARPPRGDRSTRRTARWRVASVPSREDERPPRRWAGPASRGSRARARVVDRQRRVHGEERGRRRRRRERSARPPPQERRRRAPGPSLPLLVALRYSTRRLAVDARAAAGTRARRRPAPSRWRPTVPAARRSAPERSRGARRYGRASSRRCTAFSDEVRQQERDVERGIAPVRDLEVEREDAVRIDEQVLGRPVAEHQRAASRRAGARPRPRSARARSGLRRRGGPVVGSMRPWIDRGQVGETSARRPGRPRCTRGSRRAARRRGRRPRRRPRPRAARPSSHAAGRRAAHHERERALVVASTAGTAPGRQHVAQQPHAARARRACARGRTATPPRRAASAATA